MPYLIEFDDESKFVSIVFSGKITPSLLLAGREEARRRLTDLRCDRLLVDAQDFSLTHSIGEEFDFASEHPLMLPPPIRIAIITYLQTEKFFAFVEDVAQNRGADLRAFPTREAAIRWLHEKATKSE